LVKANQMITLGEMRASGVRGLLIYCSDYAARTGRRSAAIDVAAQGGIVGGPLAQACPYES
jgi:hypothetical protein